MLGINGMLGVRIQTSFNGNTESRQDEEEVFAESYDDTESKENSGADPFRINKKFGDTTTKRESSDRNRFMGHPGCPNKWNPYHECNSWCQEHYGDGKKELDPEYPEKSTRVSCDSNLVDGTILWGDARRWKTIGDHEVV